VQNANHRLADLREQLVNNAGNEQLRPVASAIA